MFVFVWITLSTGFAADPGRVVFNGSYNAARQKAVTEKKFLLLQFTAKWCQPCKFMEREVYGNDAVQRYMDQHVVLFKIDIDDPNNAKFRKEHQVTVLPTILLMRASGKVLGRAEQSFNPEAFIAWLEERGDLKETKPEYSSTLPSDGQFSMNQESSKNSEDLDDFELLSNLQKHPDGEATAFSTNALGGDSKPTQEKFFCLQTGVFSNRTNADDFALKLLEQHPMDIRIAEELRNGKKLYKVIAGQFDTVEEAALYREFLQSKKWSAVIVDQQLNFVKG